MCDTRRSFPIKFAVILMIYAKLMSTSRGLCMNCISRVDCGLLTPYTLRCGKCAAENIGMRSKVARDERIARACSYVCAEHRICLDHRPQEVDYNIWIFSGAAPDAFTVPFSSSRALCEEEGSAAGEPPATHRRPPPAKFGNRLN